MGIRDLKAKIPGTPFTYNDVVKSDSAVKHHIANTPSELQWQRAEWYAKNILTPLNSKIPLRINSWFRSPELCVKIGSSKTSNHIRGDCADIEPLDSKVSLSTLFSLCVKLFECSEIIAENFPTGWVHLCVKEDVVGEVIKLKDPSHNYTRMTVEEILTLYPLPKVKN